ncbi:MAG TPA: nicotinate-nucleotide--dimethylbenzimidazole phosphoribosyltransferase [Pirellulales bacterium]
MLNFDHRGLLKTTLNRIAPVDEGWIAKARARQLQLTKPPGSLGRLEEIANRLAGIQRSMQLSVARARILVFAADHGVCCEGVSLYPQSVTAQMVANFLRGGAAINALANTAGAELRIVDVGICQDLPEQDGLIQKRIANGTKNFCSSAAMTEDQAVAAMEVGIEMADASKTSGCQLLGIGEMGIGNTTSASAITAALTGLEADAVVGRGAGADDAGLNRKIAVIRRALALHRLTAAAPLDILAKVGGFEIAAMSGVCLGAAANRQAVLVDGFIATAAAALAVQLQPATSGYLFASHRSTEPGQQPLLNMIGQRPILDLEMRLGEGTGAALAISIVRAAAAAFNGMATFESAGVSNTESQNVKQ